MNTAMTNSLPYLVALSPSIRSYHVAQTEYCNSIECPDSFTPIPDAMNVACEGDACSVSQCCEAFCSYMACDDGYTQIPNANTTMCADSGCTAGLCCEALCSSYPCKNNFVPVEDAATLVCPDKGCTRSLCCEYGEQLGRRSNAHQTELASKYESRRNPLISRTDVHFLFFFHKMYRTIPSACKVF